MSSVLRLEGQAEQRDLLADQRAEVLLELADDAPLLQLVDLDHGGQQLEVVAGVAGELLQGRHVFWEAANPRSRCPRSGSCRRCAGRGPCRARPRATSAPTSSHTLAISLMKRDLRGEERVRGELDHLGRGDVGAHDRAVERLVELRDRVGRPGRARRPTPTTTRSGCMKSSTAEPSFRNSGFEA